MSKMETETLFKLILALIEEGKVDKVVEILKSMITKPEKKD